MDEPLQTGLCTLGILHSTPGSGTDIPIKHGVFRGGWQHRNSQQQVGFLQPQQSWDPSKPPAHSVGSGPGRMIPLVLFSTVSLPPLNPSPLMSSSACFLFEDRFQPSALRNSVLHSHPNLDFKCLCTCWDSRVWWESC